ncbi:MAG: hypothetical protein K2F90_04240 [Clostridiales bacterium]|nr:hypothetical protein [Clostridiales bacterium]
MFKDKISSITNILHVAFLIFICVIMIAVIGGINVLIVWLVVVPNPKDIMSYVALSVILFFDFVLLYFWITLSQKRKYKIKTISKHLVFWLSVVLFFCAVATVCMIDVLLSGGVAVAIVFLCIFGGMGLADLGVLIYQMIGYAQIKLCLKYGAETTAEYVEIGKTFTMRYGGKRGGGGTTFEGVSVIFKYVDSYGEETEAASRRVYSWDEVDILEKMGTFKIKFDHRTAVILETFEPNDEEHEPTEPQADEGQAESLSENATEE